MAFIGWQELILIVAVLIFFGIIYWVGKRNMAFGLIVLIIGSAGFLYYGINLLLGLYVEIGKNQISLSGLNILGFVLFIALGMFMAGLGVYGLLSAYRALRVINDVLEKIKRK